MQIMLFFHNYKTCNRFICISNFTLFLLNFPYIRLLHMNVANPKQAHKFCVAVYLNGHRKPADK